MNSGVHSHPNGLVYVINQFYQMVLLLSLLLFSLKHRKSIESYRIVVYNEKYEKKINLPDRFRLLEDIVMSRSLEQEQNILRSGMDHEFDASTTKMRLAFEQALFSGQEQSARELKAMLLPDLKLTMSQNLMMYRLYLASSITYLVEISKKYGLPMEIAETFKRQCFLKLTEENTEEGLENVASKLLHDIKKYHEAYSMQGYSHAVKMAIEYIHNNKFRFIYARDVACAVRMDRSYLSRLFRQETKKSITDYIHQVKIDTAQELIETHIYKLSEISEMLGYSNYTYFSQVYKK